MKDQACPQERSIIEAARSDQWSEELRAHIGECESCAEVERVSRRLRRMAQELGIAEPPPDPTWIWIKALEEEQQQLTERAMRPALLAQAAAKICFAIVLGWLVLWRWTAISDSAARLYFSISSFQYSTDFLSQPAILLLCLGFGYFLLLRRRSGV